MSIDWLGVVAGLLVIVGAGLALIYRDGIARKMRRDLHQLGATLLAPEASPRVVTVLAIWMAVIGIVWIVIAIFQG